jgi:hypothetical protein
VCDGLQPIFYACVHSYTLHHTHHAPVIALDVFPRTVTSEKIRYLSVCVCVCGCVCLCVVRYMSIYKQHDTHTNAHTLKSQLTIFTHTLYHTIHTLSHIHTLSNTYTLTHTHSHIHNTHSHIHTLSLTHTHSHSLTLIHNTHSHIHTLTHVHPHIHTYTHTYTTYLTLSVGVSVVIIGRVLCPPTVAADSGSSISLSSSVTSQPRPVTV